MYTRFAALVPVAALAAVAAAAPNALPRNGGSQCSSGGMYCCNSTQQSTTSTLGLLSGLLGIVLPSVEGLIGLGCSPLTVVGVGSGSTCTQQTVCCTNNNFNGLVNLGCNPINVSL